MFWIALAAQMRVPVPGVAGISSLFSADDVPIDLVPDGEVRRVGVRVTVKPDGKLDDCRADSSSGIPKLDAYTCAIILRRARFDPAIGPDGQPTYGVIRTTVTWAVNASGGPGWADDLELTVSRLPTGVETPMFGSLMFAVDQAGHPSACAEEEPRRPSMQKLPAVLVNIACDQLLKSYVAIPARDITGRPVPSVQNATVEFSTDPR
jgi:TonB family protein